MSDDFIDEVLNGKAGKDALKPKHKMTVYIDHELWVEALPLLDRKFSALFEGAIREAIRRIRQDGNKK